MGSTLKSRKKVCYLTLLGPLQQFSRAASGLKNRFKYTLLP